MDEAAGAADAGSYGFCLVVSSFVLRLDSMTDGARELGWSLSGSWNALGGRFLGEVMAELGRTGTSRDTTGERAEARVVRSGMEVRSRRIKG